jgi:hypothetical protein
MSTLLAEPAKKIAKGTLHVIHNDEGVGRRHQCSFPTVPPDQLESA